ncbi:hypothetical protein OU415_09620 [Saccharopolyspora sp. WRP15-2]|uniref:Uncharacterized protein n=1 Tax=Saccharopolyspora oryzae TaxID=2997343 RepID=A0ABT4UVE9_9PSEU|nr:hypothetical protein [Saccharopolyspora oryzae]MDA3625694.1 hypothetical protein [Saccharopolyspora oryzae]
MIEVTGGATMGSRFVIDYADTTGIPVSRNSHFPVETSGWARADDGNRIGAVRHQFRDNAQGGFSAMLPVAFPATLPPWMITEHRWHLACEFSNWVCAFVDSAPQ